MREQKKTNFIFKEKVKMKTAKIFTAFLIIISAATIYSQSDSRALKIEAQKQMRFGRYGEAIDLLNRYISANPQNPDGYNLRGLCYEKREQFALAVYDFRSANKLAPNDKKINENLGRATNTWYKLLYNKIEGHKREIAINPNTPINYLEIGKSYKNLGEWQAAEDWYDQYLAREAASPDEIIRYTEILAKNNHIKKGEPILKRYTEQYPDDQRLWSRYGYFTLWLGKNKVAIDAFEHALAIKPYFKEAMDGLDQAKGKGYIYTVNDTSGKYNYGIAPRRPRFIYPIDRYYRILKNNPNDDDTRLKLVKELYKANRLQEAYDQIQILNKTKSDDPEFIKISDEVLTYRKKFFEEQIANYKARLSSDPYDREALLKLGEYYSNLENYDEALLMFDQYLKLVPDDMKALYLHARAAAWNRDFQTAKENMSILMSKDPTNLEYQLFTAQLSVWTGQDLEQAKEYLTNVLNSQPNNVSALIAMGSLSLQEKDFIASQNYVDKVKTIAPFNADAEKLQSDIEFQKLRAEQERLFSILQEGRTLAMNDDCVGALQKYDEYLASAESNRMVMKEYADVNACAKNFDKAIQIYSNLLSESYDPEIELQRAKVYYWMGDSVNALQEFQKIAANNPTDYTANLYLGDSYTKMHQYKEAEEVYDNMEEIFTDSTQIADLELRKSWLPVTGFSGVLDRFPSYVMVSPFGSFYTDNLGFDYNNQGIRVDLGVTQFLSVGMEASRSTLASNFVKENLNTVKWNVTLRLAENVRMGASFGNSYFDNFNSKAVGDAYIKVEEKNRYSAMASYTLQDAAQVLFSPSLVGVRMDVDLYRLAGEYKFKSGLITSGKFNYIDVSDGNTGSQLELRVGKYFYPELLVGYEYYYTDFKFNSFFYWTPQNYSSHSAYADWNLIKSEKADVSLGGKLGVITNSSVLLREIYATALYNPIDRLTLQGRISGGSSVQNSVGYSSFSINLAAYFLF